MSPKMSSPNRYTDRSGLFVAAALAYILVANTLGPLGSNRSEIFPFFNWSLFTNATAGERYDYAIFVEKIDGRALARPTLVYTLKTKIKGVGSAIDLRKASVALAFAILGKNRDNIARQRKTIERTYLRGPRQMTYSLRLMKYRPLTRYRTGEVTAIDILGRFERGRLERGR